ncbi:unnamed protein product [Cylindrotheca closterium]|uniref:Uncharacterized protein n=1 Tax=Cylindrotheca closterium TaxID=2856 RepID=A0AAD2G537_9STRA|nr:unnamed protein product [Cylindrotheca closterium]
MSHGQRFNRKLNDAHRMFLRYAQSHPATLTVAILGGSLVSGIVAFKILDDGDSYKRDPKEKMSMEEARLIAMLENAKESSWNQNLENAVDAQEQFMMPGRQRDVPDFMSRIDERSHEIMKNQHATIDKEKMRKETNTKYWSN